MRRIPWRVLMCLLAAAPNVPAVATAQPLRESRFERLEEIRELSLEELMSIDVTTLAGVPQEWFTTPAAMTVLTGEDLRRTGQRSLPEALRLVPGMFAGRQTSSFWRIGARGFTGAALPAPRNLVLVDGRTVYDPLWGGVFWDVQTIPLEDIDRIEVIRGPGATLWGPNAVNGVINVITKDASRSEGLLVKAGGGTYLRAFGKLRYGMPVGREDWARAYVKFTSRDEFRSEDGVSPRDDWSMLRAGLRVDLAPAVHTRVMTDAALYYSPGIGTIRRIPVPGAHLQYRLLEGDDEVDGGHVLGRVTRDLSATSHLTMQAYYDRTHRARPGGFAVTRHTGDLDLRHGFRWAGGQEWLWGFGHRRTADRTEQGDDVFLIPGDRTFDLFSAFAQNTSELVHDRLFAMVGSKLTHHTLTDWEAQPSVRLWWMPSSDHTIWGAVSRPVRLPSRIEVDGRFVLGYVDPGILGGSGPTGTYVPATVAGAEDLSSERLLAYELGFRSRALGGATFALSLFHHEYRDLISGPPTVTGTFNNDGTGTSRGVEAAATFVWLRGWRVDATYGFLEVEHEGPIQRFEHRNAPKHLAHVRSYARLTRTFELGTAGYYVDEIEQAGADSHFQLDMGGIWTPLPRWEFSVWGHNLTRPGTKELGSFEYPRSVYVQGIFRH